MENKNTMEMDDRMKLTEGLASFVWFRLVLVLVPASEALGSSRPGLVWAMNKILRDIKADVAAYVAEYDVRRREEQDG
jgi:hypothetical protein